MKGVLSVVRHVLMETAIVVMMDSSFLKTMARLSAKENVREHVNNVKEILAPIVHMDLIWFQESVSPMCLVVHYVNFVLKALMKVVEVALILHAVCVVLTAQIVMFPNVFHVWMDIILILAAVFGVKETVRNAAAKVPVKYAKMAISEQSSQNRKMEKKNIVTHVLSAQINVLPASRRLKNVQVVAQLENLKA